MGYKSAILWVLQRRIEGQPPMPVRSAPRQAEANVGGAAAGTMREREVWNGSPARAARICSKPN